MALENCVAFWLQLITRFAFLSYFVINIRIYRQYYWWSGGQPLFPAAKWVSPLLVFFTFYLQKTGHRTKTQASLFLCYLPAHEKKIRVFLFLITSFYNRYVHSLTGTAVKRLTIPIYILFVCSITKHFERHLGRHGALWSAILFGKHGASPLANTLHGKEEEY